MATQEKFIRVTHQIFIKGVFTPVGAVRKLPVSDANYLVASNKAVHAPEATKEDDPAPKKESPAAKK